MKEIKFPFQNGDTHVYLEILRSKIILSYKIDNEAFKMHLLYNNVYEEIKPIIKYILIIIAGQDPENVFGFK